MTASVLLMDDEPEVHDAVKMALEGYGLTIHSAFAGVEGIAAAERLRPGVILLDIKLPDMSGLDVCELLSIRPETTGIPVLILSASNTSDDRMRGLNQGAVDYIGKPFVADELAARVRANLRYRLRLAVESRRALSDPLTGLWNRAYLDDRLRSAQALAMRHDLPLSCIMADVDHFKAVNDTYGHSAGDRVLCAVADVLQRGIRVEDVAARYGGEEFAILCIATEATGALFLAERLRKQIEAMTIPCDPDGCEVRVTCSFGVATAPAKGPALGSILGSADGALYEAKRQGRNRVCAAGTRE